VTGFSAGNSSGRDCTTVAYRTATGAQVWAKRLTGPGNRTDSGRAIATSPDGSQVIITGLVTPGRISEGDCLRIGYRARTGAQRAHLPWRGAAHRPPASSATTRRDINQTQHMLAAHLRPAAGPAGRCRGW
jgi:hypothetical protein